jgi:hypothetical protein
MPPRFLLAQTTPHTAEGLGPLFYTFGFLLIFFLLMNLDRRFREYIGRSLFRPYNFFSDIRDRRLIPNFQTTLLALVIAGGIALALASLVLGFGAGHVFHKLILPESLRLWLNERGSDFGALLVLFTTFTFLSILLLTFGIRFAAMFVRGRYYASDAFNVSVWSLLPWVFLLGYDLILPRLDTDHTTAMISLLLIGVLFLWSYIRLLKGMGVLFDVYPTRMYIYGLAAIALLFLATYFYLQQSDVFANFSHPESVIRPVALLSSVIPSDARNLF